MARTLYMHTIDGRPAYFNGVQIIPAFNECRRLETSVRAIRRNEERSIKYREEYKPWFDPKHYGYVRVRVE